MENSTSSGLNVHHEHLLKQFLSLSVSKRAASLKSLEVLFQKRKNKLKDAHYTKDEVKELVDELAKQIGAEVEADFLYMVHSNFLLLRQFFVQAEEKKLKIFANFSEIENRKLLEAVADFERGFLRVDSKNPFLNDDFDVKISSGDLENSRLREENEKLKRIAQSVNEDTTTKEELEKELNSRERTVREIYEASESELKKRKKIEREHANLSRRLEEITQQLSLKESELEKKFLNTNAYLNMQKMIKGKNSTISALRMALKRENFEEIGGEKSEEKED